jgi:hypothetical protein
MRAYRSWLGGLLTALMVLATAACDESDKEAELEAISEATVGAPNSLLLPSESGSSEITFNVMRVAGLALDDGTLTVNAEVCYTDFESADKLSDCLDDKQPWKPYTLTVALGDLDDSTVRVSSSDFGFGSHHMSVPVLLADCREDAGKCVEVSLTDPRGLLGLPCHDGENCERAAESLKALIE